MFNFVSISRLVPKGINQIWGEKSSHCDDFSILEYLERDTYIFLSILFLEN